VESEDQTYPAQLSTNQTFQISYRNWTSRTCTDTFGADCSLWPSTSEGDNTFDTCPSSVGGINDEHVNEARVNASMVKPGDSVNVTCTFDPYSTGTEEYIYYYNGTGWRQLFAGSGPDGNIHDVSEIVTIDNNVGTQYFRCIADWDGENDECANVGSYYDNDDVSIEVVNPVCGEMDYTNPSVYDVLPNGTSYNLLDSVIISANVTDDTAVAGVRAIITYPNQSTTSVTMTDPDTNGVYTGTFTSTTAIGFYNITIIANDTWNNYNDTETGSFTVITDTLTLSTNRPSYIRNQTVIINGKGYEPGIPVTIQISNSSGTIMPGYPTNLTSNLTGGINQTWQIPIDEPLGVYSVNTTDTTNTSRKLGITFEVVTAVVQTDKTAYQQGEIVNITGYNWDPSVDVTINITCEYGTTVY